MSYTLLVTEPGRSTDCESQGARAGPCLQGSEEVEASRGMLQEHQAAADDGPATGKGRGQRGLGRKEAKCLGEHQQILNAHLQQLRGESLETKDRMEAFSPVRGPGAPSQVDPLGMVH